MDIIPFKPKVNETAKETLVETLKAVEAGLIEGVIVISMTDSDPIIAWSDINSIVEARGAACMLQDMLADEQYGELE